jgi:type II secretory pathway pseudopilin PulG
MKKLRSNSGVSFLEVLIVMAVLAALLTAFLLSYRGQLRKGYDGERKSDIHEIKTAFEEYFNDTGCYPIGTALMALTYCDEPEFMPWLRRVPCDPETGEPYTITVQPSACPTWYAIYTNVMQTSSEAENNPCSDPHCQVAETNYNYGVSSGNISPSDAVNGFTYEDDMDNICPRMVFKIDFKDGNCQASNIEICGPYDCYSDSECTDRCVVLD